MAIMNVWAARAQDLLTVTRISHSETSRIMGRKRADAFSQQNVERSQNPAAARVKERISLP